MAKQRRVRKPRDANDAHRQRRFTIRPTREGDGYRLSGFLPPPPREMGMTVAAAMADQATEIGPDPVTGFWAPQDQRQADALHAMADERLADHPLPDHAVVIHVDSDVLDQTEPGNGETPGGMQIPAESVIRLLCDGDIEFHLDSPDGATIGIGRVARKLPRWLARRIHKRDTGTCRFPGCNRRIRNTHHIQHWRHGRTTDAHNLVGLCWEHHHPTGTDD